MADMVINSFDGSIERFMHYLNSRHYCDITVRSYNRGCEILAQYIHANSFEQYDRKICQKYCSEILNGRNYSHLSKQEQNRIRCAKVLLEFIETGTISQKIRWKNNVMTGLCANSINGFLSNLKKQNLSESTIKHYKLYMVRFNDYISGLNLNDFAEINMDILLGYVNNQNIYGKASKHMSIHALKHYLHFLYEKGYLDTDYSRAIPKDNYNSNAKLPSLYTDEEISKMLNAVDRGNPKGKRDYAMLLLSAHLGIRASDICQLRFSEVDWDHDKISLVQKKTGMPLDLPLLPAIGNTIIDYLKYGRPESDSEYIFLRHRADYGCITYSTFHSIVTQYLRLAGVAIGKRRHGSHALRHSLAGRMLEANVPLPVITETLGHSNSNSTRQYLRIDVPKLRQCALEIPATEFYKTNRWWHNV